MVNELLAALNLGALIVMAISPAVFLLCIAESTTHKMISVCLFVVSLAGFIGLKAMHDSQPPTQVNNLYNYGEQIE